MREQEFRVSQSEIHRMHVVRLTMEGRETVGGGAKLLGVSVRQMKRLRRKMKERGDEGLLHGNRGRAPWNKTAAEKIKQVLQLARGCYRGLNDTHLTEKLKEKEKLAFSRAWVRVILRQAGSLR
jgi:transposase